MCLEHHNKDIKQTVEGWWNRKEFLLIFLSHKGETQKSQTDFVKLRSKAPDVFMTVLL